MTTLSRLDLAIRHATVVDGTGNPPTVCDIGIAEDRIVQIGRVDSAIEEYDAAGLVVTPGFVDPHSHSDWTLHTNRDAHSTIRQGVTSEIVGNCGITNAPVRARSATTVRRRMQAYGYQGPVSWQTFGEYLSDVETGGVTQNLAYLVGHSTLREAAGVAGAEVDEQALKTMEELLEEAMEAGALGMSTGLEYSLGQRPAPPNCTAGCGRRPVRRNVCQPCAEPRFADPGVDQRVPGHRPRREYLGADLDLNVRDNTGAPERGWERAVELMTRRDPRDSTSRPTPPRSDRGSA